MTAQSTNGKSHSSSNPQPGGKPEQSEYGLPDNKHRAGGNTEQPGYELPDNQPRAGGNTEQPGEEKNKKQPGDKKNKKQPSIFKSDNFIMGSTKNTLQSNTDVVPKPQTRSTDFWTDDNGNPSSMRLMSIIALFAAILCGGYTLINPKVKDVGIELTNTFLLAAVGPKAVQKFAEKKK